MTWKTHTVELPGPGPLTRLKVRERGEIGQPTLIWTHGQFFPMCVEEITPVVEILAGLEGWRVIRYDGRGHGDSTAGDRAAHHWSALGRDVLRLADGLGVDRFVAAGASMGAAAAVYAAVHAPSRLSGLILSVPPTAWNSRPEQCVRYHEMLAALERGGVDAVADILQAGVESAPADPYYNEAYQALVGTARQMSPAALRSVLEGAIDSDLPGPEQLATVTAPTLLLPVTGDPGHPLSTAEGLTRWLPAASVHTLESMTPEAARPMRAFLAAISPVGAPDAS